MSSTDSRKTSFVTTMQSQIPANVQQRLMQYPIVARMASFKPLTNRILLGTSLVCLLITLLTYQSIVFHEANPVETFTAGFAMCAYTILLSVFWVAVEESDIL